MSRTGHPGRTGYTAHALAFAIDHAAEQKGSTPTSREADQGKYGLPAAAAFTRVFGSWRAAITAAGYTPSNRGGAR